MINDNRVPQPADGRVATWKYTAIGASAVAVIAIVVGVVQGQRAADLQQRIATVESQLQTVTADRNATLQRVEAANGEVAALKDDMAKRGLAQQTLEQLQQRAAAAQQQAAEAAQQVTERNLDVARLTQESQHISDRIAQLQQQEAEARSTLSALGNEVAGAQARLEEARRALQQAPQASPTNNPAPTAPEPQPQQPPQPQ